MVDPFYPRVDITFLQAQIFACPKVDSESIIHVGNTTSFLIKGRQPMHRRFFLIRELDGGGVGIEQATGVAVRLGFLKELMEWLEQHKNWKEGGYKVADKP